tara:strand:+ start:761 stop:985 length:225 start_codon:yes stop_codon:yes gene_type:complete
MSVHIEKFNRIVQANKQKNALVTQLDTSVASNVCHSIVELQNSVIDLQKQIIDLQKKLIDAGQIEVEFDGGEFN